MAVAASLSDRPDTSATIVRDEFVFFTAISAEEPAESRLHGNLFN